MILKQCYPSITYLPTSYESYVESKYQMSYENMLTGADGPILLP